MASGRMVKTVTDLNLRQGPGTQHPVLVTLRTGTLLAVIGEQDDWLHVLVQENEGYVHRDYVQWPRAAKTAVPVSLLRFPGVTSSLVAALFEDTQLLVFRETHGWFEVVALGHRGYVPQEHIVFPSIARTTGHVNLRIGPSTEHRILEMLPPDTQIHVWDKSGEWYFIADTVRVGHLHSGFVQILEQPSPGPKSEPGTEGPPSPPLPEQDLAPPESEKIQLSSDASHSERQAAEVWNRLGGLLKSLARQLNIDPGVAVGVLAVESGGRGFSSDGRLIIRFENQVFYDRWGKDHRDRYDQHFKFNANRRWRDHAWRLRADQAWRPVHGSQEREWQAFEFARTLDDAAAKSSISMGGPQIMGFNYASLGYDSVQAMFDAFSADERNQVVGFFDFLKGRTATSQRITALRSLDFETFARLYNGSGQAVRYGELIRDVYEAFHRLRGTTPSD